MTHSRDRFDGNISNEIIVSHELKIKEINKEIKKLKAEIDTIEKLMTDIRDNCIHEYMLDGIGQYEDYYRCKLCGNETWI